MKDSKMFKTFIIRDMPVDLYQEFKGVCATEGKTMREVHMQLMRGMILSGGTIVKKIEKEAAKAAKK